MGAPADTANLLTQLDTLSTQAKTMGFSALTILPTHGSTTTTVVSTPSATAYVAGTPKPMFMSPRMQNHIHNNLHTQYGSSNANHTINTTGGPNQNTTTTPTSAGDINMMSPAPVSLAGTPAATMTTAATASGTGITAAALSTNSMAPTPTTTGSAVVTPSWLPLASASASGVTAPSPFPSSDIVMSSSTPTASGNLDTAATPSAITASSSAPVGSTSVTAATATAPAPAADLLMSASTSTSTPINPATPATPSSSSANATTTIAANQTVALSQMMDARQRDVNAQFAEKRKLRANFRIAAQMTKI
ncbi:hypothetical protein EDD11_008298 [Mortierella claussenii]|nr:hypothetical protein EDD11_008298 [Mortierella claussenii]